MLSELETKICQRLADTGAGVIGDSDKSKAMFRSLAGRGYVTLGKGRNGPLGIYTGEQVASLTEAGRKALQALQ